MEPAFQRGDILFLNNAVHKVYVGDVVVFKIKDRDIPIVHRVLKVHENENGEVMHLFVFSSFNQMLLILYKNSSV